MLNIRGKTLQLKNYYLLLIVVYGGFLVFGFSENVKGPAIPRIQSDFTMDEMQVGLVLSLNSLGYLLACSFTGFMSNKLGLKFSNLLAFGLMAASGVLIYFSTNFPLFSFSYFLLYIGNGILEIALAILGARIFTRNTGTMMNIAHFFYGLSSTIAPMLAMMLMGASLSGSSEVGWRGMYLIALSLCILPMIPAAFSRFPVNEVSKEERLSLKEYSRDPAAWLLVAVLSLAVVSELSVGGWLVNFLEKAYGWKTASASGMLSAFFLLFMLARLVLGPLIDRIGFAKSLVLWSAASGICSVAGVLLGETGAFLLAAAGIGIAPLYPTVMALLAKRYPNDSDTAISFTVTLMGIACVIGNFLIGAITDGIKDFFSTFRGAEEGLVIGLQAGYLFIGTCALLCTAAAVMLYRFLQKRNEVI